ncbi:hypothetical protein [Antarcticimicrobium sediminis]|uniref:Uncharacterized protein n=1 Tax=Antarcticimicrobium sediminis TaxID=2546227 RepID=A0A4R5F1C3_9RHOB|nr:hypothetical protein [Antarcticimicrobium sediminis]TDE41169.1 hypothetical protein E1B25_02950 [Antarcticimicrobium sediminis]
MSESVTTAQIEDVLSSIRRLVSEDGRSDPRGDQLHETRGDALAAGVGPAAKPVAKSAADPAVERSGRLVLTPALRVSAPVEPPADEADAEPDESRFVEATVPQHETRAPWSDPTTPLFAAPREPEPVPEVGFEASEDASAVIEAASETAAPDHVEALGDAQTPDVQTPDFPPQDALPFDPDDAGEAPISQETLTFHSARAESLSAKIEALEAVIGRTRDQWEPDGPSSDSYAGTPVRPIGWRDVEEGDVEQTAPPVSDGDEATMSNAHHVPKAPSGEAFDALAPEMLPPEALTPEELTEAFDVADQASGEGSGAEQPAEEHASDEQGAGEQGVEDHTAEDHAAEDQGVEDHPIEDWAVEDVNPEESPADVSGAGDSAVGDSTADELAADDSAVDDLDVDDSLSDESVIDEDSLRELVAEIVRQELQGALGERITRNVRKLVRREIHRALAAQDLD